MMYGRLAFRTSISLTNSIACSFLSFSDSNSLSRTSNASCACTGEARVSFCPTFVLASGPQVVEERVQQTFSALYVPTLLREFLKSFECLIRSWCNLFISSPPDASMKSLSST